MKGLCVGKKNETYERYLFNLRIQKQNENIDDFYADLLKLSEHCNFEHLCDSLIRDSLVIGISHAAVQKKLLYETNLTLEKTRDVPYIEGSSKETTRRGKDKLAANRVYTLRSKAILPPQKVICVTKNKVQLVDLIMADLIAHKNISCPPRKQSMELCEDHLINALFEDDCVKRRKYKTRKEAERRQKLRDQRLAKNHETNSDSDFEQAALAYRQESSDSENDIVNRFSSEADNCVSHLTVQVPGESDLDITDTGGYHVKHSDNRSNREDSFDTSDEEAITRIEHIECFAQDCGYSSDELSGDDLDNMIYAPPTPDAPGSLWSDFRIGVLKTQMTTTQTDVILAILHNHLNLTGKLPKCEKTLCKVTSNISHDNIRKISGHDYYYFGLHEQIKVHLALYPPDQLEALDALVITWNNDDLPLFKSTSESSWPILVWISNIKPKKVFPVMVTAGEGKPKDLQYLEEFVNELAYLMVNGLDYNGKHFGVLMNAVICDAPARAQVKQIMQFSSTYGCDQCESIGCHDSKRMTWPCNLNLKKRTNESFRTKAQPGHHKTNCQETPLLKLDIDMIKAFPPDFMHQGAGCMKKLILWNISGPKKTGNRRMMCKMSGHNVNKLNTRMAQMRQFIPDTFTRKPRSTIDLPRYKSVEFRQLQLYTAKIVFLDLMATEEHYYNLCVYNAALALLIDNRTCRVYNDLGAYLMEQFAEGCLELYGNAFMVMNTHSHLHFADVAMVHGSLDDASAYCFENYLGGLKKMIKSSHNAIISLVKGVQKRQAAEKGTVLRGPELQIKAKPPNNVYVDLKDGSCYEVCEVNGDSVRCALYERKEPFFSKPISSAMFGCYKVRCNFYTYVLRTRDEILSYRRAMKVDLVKLEGLDVPEYQGVAIFMAMLHEQNDSLMPRSSSSSSSADEAPSVQKKRRISSHERRRKKVGSNRASTSKYAVTKKTWAVFDFVAERPSSLMTVPANWVRSYRKLEQKQSEIANTVTFCYWPPDGKPDEKHFVKLPGNLKGRFKSIQEADDYISTKSGLGSTESEIERLQAVGKAAEAKLQLLEIKNRCAWNAPIPRKTTLDPTAGCNKKNELSNGGTPPSRTAHKVTNKDEGLNGIVTAIQTIEKQVALVPGDGTSKSSSDVDGHSNNGQTTNKSNLVTPVRKDPAATTSSGDDGPNNLIALVSQEPTVSASATPASHNQQGISRRKHDADFEELFPLDIDNSTESTPPSAFERLNANIVSLMHGFNSLTSVVNAQSKCIAALQENMQTDVQTSSSQVTKADNPWECLSLFGFPASSPEQLHGIEETLSVQEKAGKEKRSVLLQALKNLAPKLSKATTVSNIDVLRSIMRYLAPDEIWQFWSLHGKSGTEKPSFKLNLTKIYRIVCVVFTQTMYADVNTTNSTISDYLKHCAHRKNSKLYLKTYDGKYKNSRKRATVATEEEVRPERPAAIKAKRKFALPELNIDIGGMEEVLPVVDDNIDVLNSTEESEDYETPCDTIIIQQFAHVTDGAVLVKADDTDIFILLLNFCPRGDISCKVLMVSPMQSRRVLNINAAVEIYKQIMLDLMAARDLTECFNLSLISDPTTNSFYNCKKHGTPTSSHNDRVFCSRSVLVVKSEVFITNDYPDNRPDHIVLKFKRNSKSSSFTSSSSHSRIDIASAADFLSDPSLPSQKQN
ncbi:hypothetical protein GQR58_019660 [Nymphon striatum]|nr:hypothetical protein GQR58_019660 [Nymphon striatum]